MTTQFVSPRLIVTGGGSVAKLGEGGHPGETSADNHDIGRQR